MSLCELIAEQRGMIKGQELQETGSCGEPEHST